MTKHTFIALPSAVWSFLSVALLGCTGEGAKPPAAPPERAAAVAALGTCTLEVYRAFLPAAEELATATAALATDPGQRTAARAAWTRAVALWQEAEVFRLGPAAPPSESGGQDLRSPIYAWPTFGRCLVEQQIVSQGYRSPDFGRDVLMSGRGLAALEYLLFYEGTDNACSEHTGINATNAWKNLTAQELDKRKRDYAAVAAADVAKTARALVDAWAPTGGNFLREVSGTGGTVYRTTQAALNAMAGGLMYLDQVVKDLKIARPLGLRDCATATCPDALESRFAFRAKEHLGRNLDGFEKLAFGCGAPEPLGFDDLLRGANAPHLVDTLRTRMTAARGALTAIPGDDLREALAQPDAAPVRALHAAVKGITDLLKSDLRTALNLDLAGPMMGDTD